MVNWAPGLGTVLANEEVTADGRSERGNFPVFRRPLPQWMMRITAYADRLVATWTTSTGPRRSRSMQRNWIGRSTGAHVRFATPAGRSEVFTTRPDTLFGATYMVVAPEHPHGRRPGDRGLARGHPRRLDGRRRHPGRRRSPPTAARRRAARNWTGRPATRPRPACSPGAFATNPVNGAAVPVFVADYVLMGYGTGAIMAVPGRGRARLGLRRAPSTCRSSAPSSRPRVGTAARTPARAGASTRPTTRCHWTGSGSPRPRPPIIEWLEAEGHGRGAVTYRLRDWLFSRQRYWGEPFPIVYDETGLPIAVPESMLPVELPETDDFSPKSFAPEDADSTPEPPLGRLADWVEVELDLGDGLKKYRRETNTMPNWAGSCWYELRYLDPTNAERLVDPDIERYWMGPNAERPLGGVDLYVGGVEHAVLHLLYARFWHKVLFDLGHLSSSEPFHRLVNQGMLQLPAYTQRRRLLRSRGRGRRGRRPVLPRRRPGRAGVRQDRQVA